MSDHWAVGFDHLLSPMARDEFFCDYWLPQRPLYIAGSPSKFDGLIDRRSFRHALANVPPNLSLHVKAVYTDEENRSREMGCIGPLEVDAHFAAGATICATGLEVADRNIAAFVAALRRDIRSPDSLLMNAYYSPDQKGFGTHFDGQSVWILQIEGEKIWRYSPAVVYSYPSVNAPATRAGEVLEPDGVRLSAPDDSTFVEAHLKPGDVLYLPSGTWHRPIAQGFSFALTLTQPHRSAYSLLAALLRSKLLPSEGWRQHVAVFGSDIQPLKETLERRLDELKTVVADLTVRDLVDVWYKRSSHDPQPYLTDAPSTIEPDQRIRSAGDGSLLFYDDASGTVVYHRGSRYVLPPGSSAMLRPLQEGKSITGNDSAALLDAPWQETQELLRDLIQIGIIVLS